MGYQRTKTIVFSFYHSDPGGDCISWECEDNTGKSDGSIKLQPRDKTKVLSGIARLIAEILKGSQHKHWTCKVVSDINPGTPLTVGP